MKDSRNNKDNYEVKNPTIEALLKDIGIRLRRVMPNGWGFSLFLFEYGTKENPGSSFYISSANRDDFIKSLREFMAREGITSTDTSQGSTGRLES